MKLSNIRNNSTEIVTTKSMIYSNLIVHARLFKIRIINFINILKLAITCNEKNYSKLTI